MAEMFHTNDEDIRLSAVLTVGPLVQSGHNRFAFKVVMTGGFAIGLSFDGRDAAEHERKGLLFAIEKAAQDARNDLASAISFGG